jgi:hypothetical protein
MVNFFDLINFLNILDLLETKLDSEIALKLISDRFIVILIELILFQIFELHLSFF